MPISHSYHTPQEPNDNSDSDEDLFLEELDPIPIPDTGNRFQKGHVFSKNAFGASGSLGGRIQLQRLGTERLGRIRTNNLGKTRTIDQDAADVGDNSPDLQRGFPDHRHSAGTASIGDDDAPLLAHADGNGLVRKGQRPGHARSSSISNIISKLRSTPQSEIEADSDPASSRTVVVGGLQTTRFPPNIVSNAKYTPWSFLPRTLYHEFSFFLNLYFLLVALSQVIPALRIGYLSTYIAPLAFVLCITLAKEAVDDISRRRRDAEANAEKYSVLVFEDSGSGSTKKDATARKAANGQKKNRENRSRLEDIEEEERHIGSNGFISDTVTVREHLKMSRDLKVGDVLQLSKDQRVPADTIILKTISADRDDTSPDTGGEAFIRTDQLDGETDWKLRLPPALTQQLATSSFRNLRLNAGKPDKKVNEFIGTLTLTSGSVNQGTSEDNNDSIPLTIDNTAWANTVVASSGKVLAVIVYTGPQTRQAMSTSASRSKTGLLEYEINDLTKILCVLTLLLSVLLVIIERFEFAEEQKWYISVLRFLILFSTIVPISLRVNLDLAKSVYAAFIQRDKDIPETVVRTSTIPEDLGRIEYLLSDKTGTLTQNDMQLRKIHVGTVSYANDAMSEVNSYVRHGFAGLVTSEGEGISKLPAYMGSSSGTTRGRREIASRVRDLVLALALCHNVTPTTSVEDGVSATTYQASSPDEIAIVRWTEAVGLRLAHRDRLHIVLESVHTGQVVARAEILNVFPFTSEGKRMGIILRFVRHNSNEGGNEELNEPVWFFQKGADTVMSSIVAANDWLDEETSNMAREGLRTLVVGRKRLSQDQYRAFSSAFKEASLSLHDRDEGIAQVTKDFLEQDLELLGVTGVEDKLQQDVKPSLELLRNAGIKIWMLTGDKVETARCVAVSSKLVARGQYVHIITKMNRKDQALDSLSFLRSKPDACLLIDGESLALMLLHHRDSFISTAVRLSAVVACRCSPTQKAEVARLIREHTKKRICCIGDGGNDVSMIQAADVGIGIVGKEGKQASLAADFSITQFCHLTKLLVWHGRNSYKRSAKLAQFVIHRGLIISVCQTVFSIASRFEPIALYKDWLLVGYATVYTMAPVFSLVLDTDIPPRLAHLYPELYAELSTSRSLSYRTFFIWVAITLYQGCAIQLLSQFLVGIDNFPRMVSVSYTALIINELVMVAAEVTTWHWFMAVCIIGTAGVYFGSLPFLGGYFDIAWLLTLGFWWRVAAIAAVSLVPVYGVKVLRRWVRPPSYRKVQQGL